MIMAFLLINDPKETGKIDPKTKMLVTLEWPDKSVVDLDLWIRGPDGTVLSYTKKDGGYMILDRDDLGLTNDVYTVDGKMQFIRQNIEVAKFNELPPGEYVINVHSYSHTFMQFGFTPDKPEEYPTPFSISVNMIDPTFKIVWKGDNKLHFRKEITMITFVVTDEGKINDLVTGVQIPLFGQGSGSQSRSNRFAPPIGVPR